MLCCCCLWALVLWKGSRSRAFDLCLIVCGLLFAFSFWVLRYVQRFFGFYTLLCITGRFFGFHLMYILLDQTIIHSLCLPLQLSTILVMRQSRPLSDINASAVGQAANCVLLISSQRTHECSLRTLFGRHRCNDPALKQRQL
jgi:hypothetical protein